MAETLDRCECGYRLDRKGRCMRPAGPIFDDAPMLEPPRVMLDSGAYSAWFHDEPIELGDYIDYAHRLGDCFDSIVCLDVIPGKRGQSPNAAQIDAAAKQSEINHALMLKAGIEAIPVFHQGEDFKWLERMLDAQIPYIGISPTPRFSQDVILAWLDECFTRLTNAKGEPLCKTHGFGVTSFGAIRRYPWFSIDSTTWAMAAGYGTIILPPFTHGNEPDFSRAPLRFSITDRDSAGVRPLLSTSGITRQLITDHLASMGLTLSDIRASDRVRAEVNVRYYLSLAEKLVRKPFAHRLDIRGQKARSSRTAAPFDYKPRVIFAEQIVKVDYGRVLCKLGARDRLISYYAARNYKTDEPIRSYTKNGIWVPPGKKAAKKPWSQSYVVRRRLGLLARLQAEGEE